MKRLQQQKGFTLVELAIVLTIIGLLIGGILKGQQLMENARVSATMAQVKAIEGAVTTFQDTYSGVPGDLVTATGRVPNCADCGLAVAATAGDGIVGSPNWDMMDNVSGSFTGGAAVGTVNNETVLFWVELAHAGLISGITDDGINNIPETFGGSLPSARIGGGWIAGYANTTAAAAPPGRPAAAADNMTGTTLALIPSPSNAVSLGAIVGTNVLTPILAGQMDRKMDDGVPTTGFVQAFGLTASCFVVTGTSYTYGPDSSKDCGQYFKIGG